MPPGHVRSPKGFHIYRSTFDVQAFDASVFQACLRKLDSRSQGVVLALACGKNVMHVMHT